MPADGFVYTSNRKYTSLAPLVVFACGFFFYCLSLVSNFSAAHDSINYLNGIVNGDELLHPHHLFYHPTARLWFLAARSIFNPVPDYFLIETYSALWGAGILSISYLFFRNRFFQSITFSAAGTAAIALCYGTWFYSSNIEVYAPPVFLVLVCLYRLTKTEIGSKDFLFIGSLHALATLFHQVNILLILPVLVVLWQRRHNISFGKTLLFYLGPLILLTAVAYTIAGVVIGQNDSLSSFTHWILGYTIGHDYWSTLSFNTPFKAFTGLARAYIGGHFIFALPEVEMPIGKQLQGHGLADEKFLVSTMTGPAALVLIILSVVLAILMLLLCWKFVRSFKKLRVRFSSLIDPLVITLLVYSSFFLFWVPENLEFWILQSILILLLVLGSLNPAGDNITRRYSVFPFLLAILLGLINLFGSMRWLQNEKNDFYYSVVRQISDESKDGDLVLLENGWIFDEYILRFTNLKQYDLGRDSEPGIRRMIEQALRSQHRVILVPDLHGPEQRKEPRVNVLRNTYSGRLRLIRVSGIDIAIIE